MTYREYWHNISREIFTLLQSQNLIPVDVFFVGSKVRSADDDLRLDGDIDSIVLIENSLTIDSLRKLRVKIGRMLLARPKTSEVF